jgi:transcriptional regulator with XRE-family HTH domain
LDRYLEKFAAHLQKLRSDAGMTQDQLAAASKLHRTHIHFLEQAQRTPRLDTLAKLARGLKLQPSDLLPPL